MNLCPSPFPPNSPPNLVNNWDNFLLWHSRSRVDAAEKWMAEFAAAGYVQRLLLPGLSVPPYFQTSRSPLYHFEYQRTKSKVKSNNDL